MAPLNVALIGYGNSAKVFHVPFIQNTPDLTIYAVFQRSPPPQDGSGKSHCTVDLSDAKHYTDLDEMLRDPKIDLCVVVTRHDTHVPFAIKALQAGKHVVVEKPIAVSSAEADELVKAERSSGRTCFPFQNRRYDSDYQTVQQVLAKKSLGEILEFEVHYDIDFPSWLAGLGDAKYSPGDGLCFGIGCHKLDQVLHQFGKPHSVTGFLRSLRSGAGDSDVDDSYTIILQYDPQGPQKNLICTVKTNVYSKMDNVLGYLIRGRDGSFIKMGDDQQEYQIHDGLKITDAKFGIEPEDMWSTLTTRTQVDADQREKKKDVWVGRIKSAKGDYTNYYKDVARAVRGDIEPVIKLETSRDGIRVIEAARESSVTGKAVLF